MDTTRKKLLIFGGAFNPPHLGHVNTAWGVASNLGCQCVLFVTTGLAPHKKIEGVSDTDRARMILLAATYTWPNLSICPRFCKFEIDRAKEGLPSYTFETVEFLKSNKHYKDYQLFLYIGSDEASVFGKWYRPERIMELSQVVTVLRPGAPSPSDPRIQVVDTTLYDISSTTLRTSLRLEKYGDPLVVKWIPKPVLEYIREHNLYIG